MSLVNMDIVECRNSKEEEWKSGDIAFYFIGTAINGLNVVQDEKGTLHTFIFIRKRLVMPKKFLDLNDMVLALLSNGYKPDLKGNWILEDKEAEQIDIVQSKALILAGKVVGERESKLHPDWIIKEMDVAIEPKKEEAGSEIIASASSKVKNFFSLS